MYHLHSLDPNVQLDCPNKKGTDLQIDQACKVSCPEGFTESQERLQCLRTEGVVIYCLLFQTKIRKIFVNSLSKDFVKYESIVEIATILI